MKNLLVVLILSVSIFGQVKKRPPLQPKPNMPEVTKKTPVKPPFVFNENLEVLPIDYKGNTLMEIANAVSQKQESQKTQSSPSAKDEFETSAQYAKRLDEYKKNQESLQLAKTTTDKYVLVLNYQLSDYDADNQILNIRTVFTYVGNKALVNLKSDTETNSYTASNAYGATVNVNKTNISNYGIEFSGGYFADPIATAQIKLDIPTAKSLKPNLRTLIIFELIEPYSKSEITRKNPTLYSPSETINSSIVFTAKPIEIWFLDQSNGKVIAKKKIEEVKL